MDIPFENQSLIETSLQLINQDLFNRKISKFEADKREKVLLESFADNKLPFYLLTKNVISHLQRKFNDRYHFSFDCDHISTAVNEKKFSCGYKNCQILFSSLLKSDDFKETIKSEVNSIPTIWKLQALFEESWRKGFDPNGAATFSNKIYDTKKKIGVLDILYLMASVNIKCKLIEFNHFKSDPNVRKKFLDYVYNYFSETDPDKPKFPLIFQSERHSKTIIGIEKSASENRQLVILEPAIPKHKLDGLISKDFLHYDLINDVHKERFDKYQLLVVYGRINSPDEYEMGDRTSIVKTPKRQEEETTEQHFVSGRCNDMPNEWDAITTYGTDRDP